LLSERQFEIGASASEGIVIFPVSFECAMYKLPGTLISLRLRYRSGCHWQADWVCRNCDLCWTFLRPWRL